MLCFLELDLTRPPVLSMKDRALLPSGSIPSRGLQKHCLLGTGSMRLGKAFAPFIYSPHSFSPRPRPLSWVDLKRDRPHTSIPPRSTEHNSYVHTDMHRLSPPSRIINSPYFFLPLQYAPPPVRRRGKEGSLAVPNSIPSAAPIPRRAERPHKNFPFLVFRLSAEKYHTYGPGTGIGGGRRIECRFCFLNGYLSAREEGNRRKGGNRGGFYVFREPARAVSPRPFTSSVHTSMSMAGIEGPRPEREGEEGK